MMALPMNLSMMLWWRLITEFYIHDTSGLQQAEQLVRHQAAGSGFRLLQQGECLLMGDDDFVQDSLDVVLVVR